VCTAPPEPCAHLVPLTLDHLSCIDLPPCTACRRPVQRVHSSVYTHALSCHSFIPSRGRRPAQSSLASARSYCIASHNGRSFVPSAYPPPIQHAYSHHLDNATSCSLTLCLDLRCSSGCPSHIHSPASPHNIHISRHLHPVYSIKHRSASQKRLLQVIAKRTSLHLLDSLPLLLFRPRSLCRCPFCSLGSERRKWVKVK